MAEPNRMIMQAVLPGEQCVVPLPSGWKIVSAQHGTVEAPIQVPGKNNKQSVVVLYVDVPIIAKKEAVRFILRIPGVRYNSLEWRYEKTIYDQINNRPILIFSQPAPDVDVDKL